MLDRRGFQVKAQGENEIHGTREFDAPPGMVWAAWTRPELLRRWLLGPDGWVMKVCEVDARVGGAYRYVWQMEKADVSMGMGGKFLVVEEPRKLVSTEKFDEPWYPGEMVGTLEFVAKGGKTLMYQTLRYESREARDMALKSPMEEGLVVGYNRLDEVLAGLRADLGKQEAK
jgi:uncharacterized protein YndB with AHSA1/START domain